MPYKPFLHVERLGSSAVDGILDGVVYVTPKLDGTNACVWSDDGLSVKCGSRKRELPVDGLDNANFRRYIQESDDVCVEALRRYVLANPGMVVYGEWLGGVQLPDGSKIKYTGSIKSYVRGGFFAFDLYDFNKLAYVARDTPEWRRLETCGCEVVPVLAKLSCPSIDDVMEWVENNRYNLPAGVIGEGVVLKNYAYRDRFGHFQEGKVVRQEFHDAKRKSKKVYAAGELEQEFIDAYCTASYLDKTANKVRLACGADEFDAHDKKMVGMFMARVSAELIGENIAEFVKKKKMPVIDFGRIDHLVKQQAREFLGL